MMSAPEEVPHEEDGKACEDIDSSSSSPDRPRGNARGSYVYSYTAQRPVYCFYENPDKNPDRQTSILASPSFTTPHSNFLVGGDRNTKSDASAGDLTVAPSQTSLVNFSDVLPSWAANFLFKVRTRTVLAAIFV